MALEVGLWVRGGLARPPSTNQATTERCRHRWSSWLSLSGFVWFSLDSCAASPVVSRSFLNWSGPTRSENYNFKINQRLGRSPSLSDIKAAGGRAGRLANFGGPSRRLLRKSIVGHSGRMVPHPIGPLGLSRNPYNSTVPVVPRGEFKQLELINARQLIAQLLQTIATLAQQP